MLRVDGQYEEEGAASDNRDTITPAQLERAHAKGKRLRALEVPAPPWCFLSEHLSILEPEARTRMTSMAGWSRDEFMRPLTSLSRAQLPASWMNDLGNLLPSGAAAMRDSSELHAFRNNLDLQYARAFRAVTALHLTKLCSCH